MEGTVLKGANTLAVSLRDMEGLRVVRGPDWRWGNQDGGEGFVGTVVSKAAQGGSSSRNYTPELKPFCVNVVWDSGHCNSYRVGHEGAFDLRVVDNVKTGIFHYGIHCGECCARNIKGFRWFCNDCDTNVCSQCFLKGNHDASHSTFQLFENARNNPITIVKSPTEPVEVKGLFPGALVRPVIGDSNGVKVDAFGNCFGEVQESNTLSPGLVRVKWPAATVSLLVASVRDVSITSLRMFRHGIGGSYIAENLPLLKAKEHETSLNSPEDEFAIGDSVRVIVDAAKLEELQCKEGWIQGMQQIVGQEGTVIGIENARSMSVNFPRLRSYIINRAALERVNRFRIGQPVRVKLNTPKPILKAYCVPEKLIDQILGKTGCIVRCISDNAVCVKIFGLDSNDSVFEFHNAFLAKFSHPEAFRDDELANLKKCQSIIFLHAAVDGHLSVLKQLVADFGIAVDERGINDSQTALHKSCQSGRTDVIEWLVSRGADVQLKDFHGRRAIHHASMSGEHKAIKLLVRHGAGLDDQDDEGLSPLHLAVRYGCLRTVTTLISLGCDVNAKDSQGDTPLHHAIYWENQGLTVYRDQAIVDCLIDVCDLAILNSKKLDALSFAAFVSNRRVVKRLLTRNGELVNVTPGDAGNTPLHISCYKGDFESVKIFMDHLREMRAQLPNAIGSYLERRCNKGLTPLLAAAENGHYSVIEFLMERGANLEARTEHGDTAVHLLAAKLDTFQHLPTDRGCPKISYIYDALIYTAPRVAHLYPVLAAMCHLVSKGCPWRNAGSVMANRIVNEPTVRELLSKYSRGIKHRDDSENQIACMLCPTTDAYPACFHCCNAKSKIACGACCYLIVKCPACGSANPAYQPRESIFFGNNVTTTRTRQHHRATSQSSQSHGSQPLENYSNYGDMRYTASETDGDHLSSTHHAQHQRVGQCKSVASTQFHWSNSVCDSAKSFDLYVNNTAIQSMKFDTDAASANRNPAATTRATEVTVKLEETALPTCSSPPSSMHDVMIPISEISRTNEGHPIISYKGFRFSPTGKRGDNTTVYQCRGIWQNKKRGQHPFRRRCAAIIEEMFDPVTKEVVKYVMGPIGHDKHEELQLNRRTRLIGNDTNPCSDSHTSDDRETARKRQKPSNDN